MDSVRRFNHLSAAQQGLLLCAAHEGQDLSRLMELQLSNLATGGKSVMLLGCDPCAAHRFPVLPLPAIDEHAARLIGEARRHDPQLLVVEQLNGGQAMAAACRVALGSTLVLAGLLAGSRDEVLNRLIHYRQRHILLSTAMQGLVVVRQISTVCPACRRVCLLTAEESDQLRRLGVTGDLYRGTGCPDCAETGTAGTRYLFDVVAFDREFRSAFAVAESAAELSALLDELGSFSILRQAADLLHRGEVSPEEYLKLINS